MHQVDRCIRYNNNGIESVFIKEGVIEDIFSDGRNCIITISYWVMSENATATIQSIRLVVDPDTKIVDSYGKHKCCYDLKKNMRIDVEHSPYMTMSLPPQAVAYRILILND